MNLLELQNRVLSRSRREGHDSHRRQLARDIINDKIQEILSKNSIWPFMHSTTDILSVNGTALYALPRDFSSIEAVYYNGARIEIFRTGIEDRYVDDTTTTSDDVASTYMSGTIRRMTTSSLASAGTIYPTYGSNTVTGVGTSFVASMVDHFIRASRDGDLYRISAVNSTTEIVLNQDFGGKSQAGTVSVYVTDQTQVFGAPGITNFSEEMIGRRMQIQGNGATTFVINAVDEVNQIITIAASSAVGTDLIYSVQDSYNVDPTGAFVLYLTPTPTVTGDTIQVDYVSIALPLTGPQDVPCLPEQFHWVIAAGAQADYMAIDQGDPQTIQFLGGRFQSGVDAILGYDPLENTMTQQIEPDVVRLRRRNSAR